MLVRSLRTDARRIGTHLLRGLFVVLIYGALLVAQEGSARVGAPGLGLFNWIIWLNFLAISLAGASFFSSVITEEKEEQTLGLLRMTGIGPLALLLGKSVPRLITAAVLLSLQLPFTLLAVTLGGVTIHQILAAYSTLMAYIVLIASVGLFCSVVCRRSRAASTLTVVFLIVFLIVAPATRAALAWPPNAQPRAALGPVGGALLEAVFFGLGWIVDASPFQRLRAIGQTGFAQPLVDYQVVSNLVFAAALFGLSWAVFERFNRGEASAGPERGFQFRRAGRLRRTGMMRAWGNPIVWKDFYFIAGGRNAVVAKLIVYGLIITGLIVWIAWMDSAWGDPLRIEREQVAGVMLVAGMLLLAVELALLSARVFHEEVKWKTLSTLLMLPKSTSAIAWSKVAGCLIGLVPAATCLLLGTIVGVDLVAEALEDIALDAGFPAVLFLLAQYLVMVYLTAFLSLFIGAGALPLAFFAVCFLNGCGISLFALSVRSSGRPDGMFLILSLIGLSIIAALHVAIGARLRRLAAQ